MSNHDRENPQSQAQDSALKRAWEKASDEQPPSGLDAAIVAAARKSVQDHGAGVKAAHDTPRPRNWFMRWQPLAAAATVAGLAFVLVQMLPRDRDAAPSIRIEEPARHPAMSEVNPARPSVREPREATEEKVAVPATSIPKPTAKASDSATDGATSMQAVEADRQEAAAADAASTGTVAAAPDVPDAGSVAAAPLSVPVLERSQRHETSLTATDRAARIAALYASGDESGAADALRAFRKTDPDADSYLPASLSDWARTVE
jgi:hypothetical protein